MKGSDAVQRGLLAVAETQVTGGGRLPSNVKICVSQTMEDISSPDPAGFRGGAAVSRHLFAKTALDPRDSRRQQRKSCHRSGSNADVSPMENLVSETEPLFRPTASHYRQLAISLSENL